MGTPRATRRFHPPPGWPHCNPSAHQEPSLPRLPAPQYARWRKPVRPIQRVWPSDTLNRSRFRAPSPVRSVPSLRTSTQQYRVGRWSAGFRWEGDCRCRPDRSAPHPRRDGVGSSPWPSRPSYPKHPAPGSGFRPSSFSVSEIGLSRFRPDHRVARGMHAPSLKGIAVPPKGIVPEPVNGIPLSLFYHQNADFSSTGDLQNASLDPGGEL